MREAIFKEEMQDPQIEINNKFDSFLLNYGVPMDEYHFDIDDEQWAYFEDLYDYINNRY